MWYLSTSNICILKKAIGTRLSEICHSDSESPANILVLSMMKRARGE